MTSQSGLSVKLNISATLGNVDEFSQLIASPTYSLPRRRTLSPEQTNLHQIKSKHLNFKYFNSQPRKYWLSFPNPKKTRRQMPKSPPPPNKKGMASYVLKKLIIKKACLTCFGFHEYVCSHIVWHYILWSKVLTWIRSIIKILHIPSFTN